MTTIAGIRPIDFNDKAAIEREIDNFAEKYAHADIEFSLTISRNNNVYLLIGEEKTVNTGLLEAEILDNSIGIHNHTIFIGENKGDSFSFDDLDFANYYKTGKQYLISGERRDAFEFTQNYSAEEITEAWTFAKWLIWEKHLQNQTKVIFEQEEILQNLNLFLEGFNFYENL